MEREEKEGRGHACLMDQVPPASQQSWPDGAVCLLDIPSTLRANPNVLSILGRDLPSDIPLASTIPGHRDESRLQGSCD